MEALTEYIQKLKQKVELQKQNSKPKFNLPISFSEFLEIFSQYAFFYDYKISHNPNFNLKVFPDFKTKLEKLYRYLKNDKSAKGLYIFGNFGTGKTMTITIIFKILKLFNPKIKYRFIKASEIINLTFLAQKEELYFEYLNRLKTIDNLIIDDLGNEISKNVNFYGTKLSPLENILENRYNDGKTTFITSNYSLDDLISKGYSPYIIDRFRQMFYFFEFNWKSLRN